MFFSFFFLKYARFLKSWIYIDEYSKIINVQRKSNAMKKLTVPPDFL